MIPFAFGLSGCVCVCVCVGHTQKDERKTAIYGCVCFVEPLWGWFQEKPTGKPPILSVPLF